MRAAFAKRGVTDPEHVTVEAWGIGAFSGDEDEGRRLAWTPCWVRDHPEGNPYARPVEGLYAIVDLNTMEVVRVEDHGVVPLPPRRATTCPKRWATPRRPAPLEVVQPEGPSFAVDGREVPWQKWTFRIGFTPREGLVLHDVAYGDGGAVAPVIRRASICEMVVPYGDPAEQYYRKNAFDIGEYGIGTMANSLELGLRLPRRDPLLRRPPLRQPGRARDDQERGLPARGGRRRALEAHRLAERPVGGPRVAPAVVSFIATVGNYDYGFFWHFYQDGSIQCEVKLTGIMNTTALAGGTTPAYGGRRAPAQLRRSTSTSSPPGSTWTWTARRTASTR